MSAGVVESDVLRITDLDTEPARDLVGGKAWSLWRMARLGLRVPPAIVVTTRSCAEYFERGRELPDGLFDRIAEGIAYLEQGTDRTFGRGPKPLLVSVRSGAAVSMPGMMDTILNLGITEQTEAALAEESGSAGFAADVRRRFSALYGKLVCGSLDDLEDLPDTAAVLAAIAADTGGVVPDDPMEALRAAVAAVFDSSRSRRAIAYRKHYGIPDDIGTAVTVQAMVFGNLDDDSGTGVLFTRNPLTGAHEPYGEYLPRGQGEDVVSGRVTPEPLTWLSERRPQVHAELMAAAELLDREGADAQDIEFTVQHGALYLLQSRPAKRTARAAVGIATTLVAENAIDPATACERVTAEQIRTLLRPVIDADAAAGAIPIATGVSAGPGYAVGIAVADADEAQRTPGAILVRESTSPEDVHGMIAAAAVVTENGGSTSHAAVVSRALDTPCIVGCGSGTVAALVGRRVTVDATTGRVYAGEIASRSVSVADDPDLAALVGWAREIAPIRVVADAAEIDGPIFDTEAALAQSDTATPTIPPGTAAASGAWLDTADGAQTALRAGVRQFVSAHPLPLLLTAIAYGKDRS